MGGRCGLSGLVVLVALGVVVVAAAVSGGQGFILVIRFLILVVGLVLVVRLILARAGLLAVPFPVAGVNQMSKCLHGFKGGRFALLTHDVLDAFR